MEDPKKIQLKIKELEKVNDGTWVSIDGNYALTVVTGNFTTGEGIIFKPTSGLIMKAFFNRATGEIKIFDFKLFEQNGN